MNRKYLAMTVLILASISFVTCLITDAIADDQEEPYIVFLVDGSYYAEIDVADLDESTIPSSPYKEGCEFICWMNAWNQPVYDLLSYDYHDGKNQLWAYFENESQNSTTPVDPNDEGTYLIAIIILLTVILVLLIIATFCFGKFP